MATGHDADESEKERVIEGAGEKEGVIGADTEKGRITEAGGESGGLGRRSFVKMAGTVASAALFGSVGAGADSEDFDVVEVPAGQTHTVHVGNSETFENTLIDITADGAEFRIFANANDFEIRNVGIRGNWDHNWEKVEPFTVAVPNPNSSGLIENFYFEGRGPYEAQDAAASGGGDVTGIFVSPSHSGELTIRNVNIQWCPDNAIYGSGPGNPPEHPATGGGGAVRIEDSYARGCRGGHFRVGSEGSYIENCVVNAGEVNGDGGKGRGAWGFYDRIEVRDCDLVGPFEFGGIAAGDGHWQDDAVVEVSNTRFESITEHSGRVVGESAGSPQRSEPEDVEGVPLSPEDAARGGSGQDDASTQDDPDRVITIIDEWPRERSNYEFTVDGDLEKSEDNHATIDDEDEIDGSTATGFVHGGRDSYRFSGEITDFSVDGPVAVVLDGDEVEPAELASDLSDYVTIESDGRGRVEYEFSVDGDLEKSVDNRATIDDEDEIDGSTATGFVWGWKDSYRFSGEITEFELDGPARIELNGEEVDPDSLTSDD